MVYGVPEKPEFRVMGMMSCERPLRLKAHCRLEKRHAHGAHLKEQSSLEPSLSHLCT